MNNTILSLQQMNLDIAAIDNIAQICFQTQAPMRKAQLS